MSKSILNFKKEYPELLCVEAEKILGENLTLGRHFPAADSYSYLLEANEQSYVGKIYKFEYWPPVGKLELISKLLEKQGVKHEEIVFTELSHKEFKNGWSISKYISGSNIEELKDKGELNSELYFRKIGEILKNVHKIKFDFFGSIHKSDWRVDNFAALAVSELDYADFSDLPNDLSYQQGILEDGKKWVREHTKDFEWPEAVLVHDDVNNRNVLWNNGNLILIDWVDSLAAVPLRDFTTLTFREEKPVLEFLEEGYGRKIDEKELKFHQVMRLIRLARFYYFEGSEKDEFEKMVKKLEVLLNREEPFGTILEEKE
jgi:aminoglycoside phosphotransferase (APT) family kinase protein